MRSLMFTVIMHDWNTDVFIGSKEFSSLSEAQSWAALQEAEYGVPADIQETDVTHTVDS